MYIKNVFNIKNFKGLNDGLKVTFDDITYLVGDNAKNKSTIGGLPLWILTGYSLYGNNREVVSNDNRQDQVNTVASMTIVDNQGSEHTITRCKGKDNFVMVDGIRSTQEVLSRYYIDVHSFLCSYNPSFFRSLDLAKQRELLIRILPNVSFKEAFNLLEQEEKEILAGNSENLEISEENMDLKKFCKDKRSEIKALQSDLDKITGSKSILIDLALEKEGEEKVFDKQKELDALENEYERLISNGDEMLNVDDLEKNIEKINQKLNSIIKVELKDLQDRQEKEISNLESVSDKSSSTCPVCKNKITNENLVKALSITYRKNINSIGSKIENLKNETKELLDKRSLLTKKCNEMKNPEIQEQVNKRENLKIKIDALRKEKQEIDSSNKTVILRKNQIQDAKNKIENFDKEAESITDTIDLYTKQIKVANRLNILMIQEQMKKVDRYLNHVSVEFSKVDETTGEIIDCYQVKYDGRDYEKLSKSYKLRADIEIAILINKVMGTKSPMFIDDVESITQINFDSGVQTILAKVIKYNDLEVLYSYQDVLQREKESINKIIEESNTSEDIAA